MTWDGPEKENGILGPGKREFWSQRDKGILDPKTKKTLDSRISG
jgi:hypothetical protein